MIIDCPHCQTEVNVPANVQTPCPNCRQPVIAEDVPRVRAKNASEVETPRWQLAFVLLISLPALGWWFMQKMHSPARPSSNHKIEYHVGGSARSASITLSRPSGSMEQHDVNVPWSQSYHANSGDVLVIAAQNKSSTGDVTVTILVDGITANGAASSAEYGIATTQVVVP